MQLARKKSVSCLEADVAFFNARLMLVKEPKTHHQQAQIKTYDTLRQIFQSRLLEQRRAQQSQSGQASERRAARS